MIKGEKKLFILSILLILLLKKNSYAEGKPNIIFIMSDDLGYGDLGSYGQVNIKTPELDKMASEGIRFTQHYAGSPLCAPTRVSLMTGKHCGHTSVRQNKISRLIEGEETLGTVLKKAGYKTGCIGKWATGWDLEPDNPSKFGFDYFFGYVNQSHAHNYYTSFLYRNGKKVLLNNVVPGEEQSGPKEGTGYATVRNEYTHDLFTKDALKYIEDNKDSTFFLHLCYTIPHVNNEADDSLELEVPDLGIYENEAGWSHAMKAYAALISRMDRDVGSIIEKLEELNIDENTIVFFTGDNGPHKKGGYHPDMHNSTGPLNGLKFTMYEGGIRVPLIARWPAHIKSKTVTDHQAAFWDFMATACDIAGVEPHEDSDGISYLPTLLGKNNQIEHEYLYWERIIPNWKAVQAVRWGNWKAVREIKFKDIGDRNFWPKMELYNLGEDVGETTEIAGLHPEVVSQIEQFMMDAHEPDPTGNLPDIPDFVTGVEENFLVPSKFTLYQNFPNPFNPSTIIQYDVNITSEVNLEIYNVSGERVIELIDDVKSAGKYTAQWDAKNNRGYKVPSGIYFYKLTIKNNKTIRSSTKKMIVLK